MDKAAAIQRIRTELTEGNIEAALQLLIDQLGPKRKSLRDLHNRALQAKAQLQKTQKDELQGVISFENSKLSYNQITQQVIGLVDQWEDPSLAPPPPANSPKKFTPQMIMVAAALIVFTGIIVWQLMIKSNTSTDEPEVVHATDICPELEASAFSIMVLPFSPLVPLEGSVSPHKSLAKRLDRFKTGFSGKFNTVVFSKDQPEPSTDSEAIQAAEECLAKLAIWGEYEHLSSAKDRTIITTSYKYLSSAENFNFTMLNLDENAEVEEEMSSSLIPTQGFFVDTVQNYSEIINQATLSEELENQFRLLFGVAEMQSGGNTADAIEILEKTNTQDSASILLKEMALAEGYMQKGDQEGAVKAYDRVLNTHPDYWFAVNNRAMIYYEKGEYDKTLEALDKKLQKDPENISALTIRGSVRLKTLQLKEAEEDLEKAQRLSEEQKNIDPKDKQRIRKKIDLLEEKKAGENKRVNDARISVNKDPNDLAALTELAEANCNLGNYSVAKDLATKILQIDQDNLKGLAIKLESADKTQDHREVTNIKREVLQLDASRQRRIIEDRPSLRGVLNNVRIQ